LLDFLEIVGKLKTTKRSGWVSQLSIQNPESVADHSYRCALMAIVLTYDQEIDKNKVVQMLLLHDIQEAITGDYDSIEKKRIGRKQVRNQQANAIQQVTSLLPELQKERYLTLWQEYEKKTTPEAAIANDIDKIEMLIQALEYEKQGYETSKLNTFWKISQEQIKTQSGKKWLKFLKQKRRLNRHQETNISLKKNQNNK
jgi:putative hydrolase of HD superfamily